MNLTIERVFDSVRPWTSQQGGPMVTILVEFTNGKRGQLNAKADNKDKRIAEMQALIGQAGEFEVDEGDGKFPMKVKSWPGKVAFGAGGGGGGGGSKWQPKSIEERNEDIALRCLGSASGVLGEWYQAWAVQAAAQTDSTFEPTPDFTRMGEQMMELQSAFFANTIRLARGSETVPPASGAVQGAVSDRSGGGEGRDATGQRGTAVSSDHSSPSPDIRSEGGGEEQGHPTVDSGPTLLGTPPPSEPTGQAATDDIILIDNKQMARIHAIAAELDWDHDALKRNVKGLRDRSLKTYTWAEAQHLIDVMSEKLDRERGLA